jgi:hypothetical protein
MLSCARLSTAHLRRLPTGAQIGKLPHFLAPYKNFSGDTATILWYLKRLGSL